MKTSPLIPFSHRVAKLSRPACCISVTAWLLVGAAPRTEANTVSDKFSAGSDLTVNTNYTTAPTATSDVRFTTSSANLTLGGGTNVPGGASLTVESLDSQANSTSFTISNATATAGNSTITLGNPAGFTNFNDSMANDLIALTGSGNLTIQGANSGTGSGTLGLTLASVGNFDVTGSGVLTISSNITANYALALTGAGTTIFSGSNTFAGTLSITAGELDVAGDASLGAIPASPSANITVNGGRLGSTTGSIFTINANRTILLGSTTGTSISVKGTGAVTYNGSFQDLSTNGILVKQGAGTLYLGGTNTYTGATTINTGTINLTATNTLAITSGITIGSTTTLSLAANSALATPGASTGVGNGVAGTTNAPQVPVSLAGGTLLRNGTGVSAGSDSAVGVGALTLTAASTLDYGTTGVGTLNFNGFVDTNNVVLTVTDYARATANTSPGVDGTDDRLIFNQDLTPQQLLDISFNGTAAQEFALGNGEYEVTPMVTAVPEPATLFGGLLVAGAAIWNQRRRAGALFAARAVQFA